MELLFALALAGALGIILHNLRIALLIVMAVALIAQPIGFLIGAAGAALLLRRGRPPPRRRRPEVARGWPVGRGLGGADGRVMGAGLGFN